MNVRVRWKLAIGESDLDSTAKLVAFALERWMSKDADNCYPSRETIAAFTSLSKRAVDGAISRLKDAGFLDVERSKGRHVNRYRGTIPNGAADARFNGAADALLANANSADDDTATVHLTTTNGAAAAPELERELENRTGTGNGPVKITKAEAEATAAFLRANGLHTTLKEIHA